MPTPSFPPLEPLRPRSAPVAAVRQLLAVGTVHLTARHAPRPALTRFYTHTLGLMRIPEDQPHILSFRHDRRIVTLSPDHDPGQLALAVTQFATLTARLRDAHIPFELLRYDGGLARMLILRDPAMNLIQLAETRPF